MRQRCTLCGLFQSPVLHRNIAVADTSSSACQGLRLNPIANVGEGEVVGVSETPGETVLIVSVFG